MSSALVQQFDIFAQLVASGSIAACARALEIEVPTVVEQMNRLEERMGFQIFAVVDGAVELTESGRKVAKALSQLSIEDHAQWVETFLPDAIDANADAEPIVAEWEELEPEELPAVSEAIEAGSDQVEGGPDAHHSLNELADETQGEDRPITPRHFEPRERRANQPRPLPAPVPAAEPPATASLTAQQATQNIVLASDPAIFGHFQEALVAFEDASPDIGITLRMTSLDEGKVSELFDNEMADIAYFYALEAPRALASRYAWSERISLFVRKDHPLASKDVVMAEDITPLSHIALMPGNIARDLSQRALAQSGLETGAPVAETDNLYEIMKYIEANNAYFATFGPTARDFGKMSGIRRLAYAQALPQVQVHQAVRPALKDDPAVLALAEFLFR